MMAESEDPPVLLTEGGYVQEGNRDKDSDNQVVPSENTEKPQEDEGASGIPNSATPASAPVGGDARPATAPEPGLAAAGSRIVEHSIMKAISDSQNSLPGSVTAGEGEGGDFNEGIQQDTLSDRLDQLPSEMGDGVDYIAPPEDPYARAVLYMEKYKVMQIFQKLTAEIVYHRPTDPLEHMLSELQKMKKEREAEVEAIISSASNHTPIA